jgi:hypothetical protein
VGESNIGTYNTRPVGNVNIGTWKYSDMSINMFIATGGTNMFCTNDKGFGLFPKASKIILIGLTSLTASLNRKIVCFRAG